MGKGDRIRQLREQKGMTQEELARLLNTKRQTISKYEKGIVTNIPSDRVEDLAHVLDSTPEYILGWDEIIEERKQKVDVAVDIVVRLGSDQQFCDAVKMLYKLDSKQLSSVTQMLSSFFRDGSE